MIFIGFGLGIIVMSIAGFVFIYADWKLERDYYLRTKQRSKRRNIMR